jgi:hypothetical protein
VQPLVGTDVNGKLKANACFDNTGNLSLAGNVLGAGIPGYFSVKSYGAVGDAKAARNCVFISLSGVVTDPTDSPWLPSDVGKKFSGVVTALDVFNTSEPGAQGTITGYTSASSITVSPATVASRTGTGQCAWYTQDDTAAFTAAYTAAHTPAFYIGYNSPALAYQGTVIIPPGGYAVSGPVLAEKEAGSNGQGVSLLGIGTPVFYLLPNFVPAPTVTYPGGFITSTDTQNFTIGGFSVTGLGFLNTNLAASQDLIDAFAAIDFSFQDIQVNDFGSSSSTDGVIAWQSAQQFYTRGIRVQSSPAGDAMFACFFYGDNAYDIIREFCSNHHQNLRVGNSSPRAAGNLGGTFRGHTGDECSAGVVGCVQIDTGSTVNFVGGDFFNPGGGVPSISIDGTSIVYLTDGNVSSYASDPGNSCGITLAAGGALFLSTSDVAGNNTSAAICGTATSTVVDTGGNKLFNQVSGTRTLCTPANFATCAFSGGQLPKASLTHLFNTCYAVTGNLLATAQNLCTILLDQNYMLENITAQSGGTTPAVSSCATAPVITVTDGTRSATLTMTTGNTTWSSTGLSTIFAGGATLTVSIGVNTCVTSPSNVSVEVVMQSVLNN